MLIENAKQAWRFVSVQIAALAVLLQGALVAFPNEFLSLYMMLPAEVKQYIPVQELIASPWMKRVILLLIVAIIVARVVKQPKLQPTNPIQDPK